MPALILDDIHGSTLGKTVIAKKLKDKSLFIQQTSVEKVKQSLQ
jgi:hypothetical protein